jgi:hypothetical protein
MAKTKKEESGPIQLDGLDGRIDRAVVFPDSHFGLESAIWENAQRICDLLPIPIKISGDLEEQEVADMSDKAKGAQIQAIWWTAYAADVSSYLKSFYKIREKQADIAETTSEYRLKVAELEKELGTTLAGNEAKYRGTIADYRSGITTKQDELEISLSRVVSNYTTNKNKREIAESSESKKDQSPFNLQKTKLTERIKLGRDSKVANPSLGITTRIVRSA